ncbi:DUF2732 family protein [Pectobacterium aroidearum]|uniref:DUF2732 family protein n=1 Tax=Pectobacterium aroidearum TaxID=1201031 RepID=UPI002A82FE38|nr:DUF2732 family protein [Pectobacterium aroidearum]MDY4387741.1 DUF2732 family protein [Pectobacterium aroidearum]
MRNIQTPSTNRVAGNSALLELMRNARLEEKKDQHFSFAMRLAGLAIHFQQKECSATEIIELLRKEAERFEHSAQELVI